MRLKPESSALTGSKFNGRSEIGGFTLQQLIEHFTIPDVPDVATLNPERHQRNLALPHEIEEIIAL